MCGIIGYNGTDDAIPYLVEGIKNLEYRGYDSFGCAFDKGNSIVIKKDIGRVEDVINKYKLQNLHSNRGVFHTRWATTGSVTVENAHPIMDCTGRIAVAHNGIIENWTELKDSLHGHKFVSNTDTEVLSHLIEENMKGGNTVVDAVKTVFKKIKGSSSFVVLNRDSNELVAIKKGSPLVLGLAKNGIFISSDVPSFVKHTNRVIYLFDGDMAIIGKKHYKISNLISKKIKHNVSIANFSAKDADKGGYEHFMLKEIMEQPGLLKKLEMSDFGEILKIAPLLKTASGVYLVGAGTSFHAARLGARMFRENGINAIPVQGQDLITYKNVILPNDVFIIISQSGETADIITALPIIKANRKIGIINVEGSTLSRAVDILVSLNTGPEKSVASTKAFTLSAVYLTLIAAATAGTLENAISDLKLMNINMYNLLVPSVLAVIRSAAEKINRLDSIFFLGRDYNYIVAVEAALKMKEVAYIHAEAIDAATFKHGPIALVSDKTYAIAFVSGAIEKETLNNLQEVKARGCKIIGIANKPQDVFDIFIRTQDAGRFDFVMQAIIAQLLAYETARKKGLDIDHPKNLAKSVTTL
jgi:glucosamine--fructose-6-phosphate aminotransferase (isomerizing)